MHSTIICQEFEVNKKWSSISDPTNKAPSKVVRTSIIVIVVPLKTTKQSKNGYKYTDNSIYPNFQSANSDNKVSTNSSTKFNLRDNSRK